MKQPTYPIFFDFIRFFGLSFLIVYSRFMLMAASLSRPRCPFRQFRFRRDTNSIVQINHPDRFPEPSCAPETFPARVTQATFQFATTGTDA